MPHKRMLAASASSTVPSATNTTRESTTTSHSALCVGLLFWACMQGSFTHLPRTCHTPAMHLPRTCHEHDEFELVAGLAGAVDAALHLLEPVARLPRAVTAISYYQLLLSVTISYCYQLLSVTAISYYQLLSTAPSY